MTDHPVQKCVMIIAGEVSGDHHGAKLVRAMRAKDPDLFFCGIGSRDMRAAGVRILVDSTDVAVVGITEILARLPHILGAFATTRRVLKSLKPDLLILIDFPGFNMHVASIAKRSNIPVLYYISPQLWAWRPGRVKKLKQLVDHMAVILPFEEAFYREHAIPVTFVGHPLLDEMQATGPAAAPSPNKPIIGLLPGSRANEIRRILPVQLAAARLLRAENPDLHFILSVAPSINRTEVELQVEQFGCADFVELSADRVENIFGRCTAAIAASGTVTLEAALNETPLVIVYKVSPFSNLIGRLLIHVEFIGLANLIAGEQIVPELVQDEASPENIARHIQQMLDDPDGVQRIRAKLKDMKSKLGGAGASRTTAEIAMRLLASDSQTTERK